MQLPLLKESCQIGHDHIKEGSSLQMYLDFFGGGGRFYRERNMEKIPNYWDFGTFFVS